MLQLNLVVVVVLGSLATQTGNKQAETEWLLQLLALQ
jgi:hypothetical protein